MNRLFKNRTKTEALLIYIRSILEELFYKIENEDYIFNLITQDDSEIILEDLKELLQLIIINDIKNAKILQESFEHKNTTYSMYIDELIQYYNSIVLEIEKNIKNGDLWIPEQFILALLSEWILEEKHIQHYSFLSKFDYLFLLSKFENINKSDHKEYKEKVSQMFKIAGKTIDSLKNKKFVSMSKKNRSIKKRNKKK